MAKARQVPEGKLLDKLRELPAPGSRRWLNTKAAGVATLVLVSVAGVLIWGVTQLDISDGTESWIVLGIIYPAILIAIVPLAITSSLASTYQSMLLGISQPKSAPRIRSLLNTVVLSVRVTSRILDPVVTRIFLAKRGCRYYVTLGNHELAHPTLDPPRGPLNEGPAHSLMKFTLLRRERAKHLAKQHV